MGSQDQIQSGTVFKGDFSQDSELPYHPSRGAWPLEEIDKLPTQTMHYENFEEIPQIYHTFASNLIPPQMG